jgi:hypothetical protein
MRYLVFYRQENAAQLGIQYQVPFGDRVVVQQLLERDACIVERHIESAIGRYHPIDEGLDVILDKYVGAHIGRPEPTHRAVCRGGAESRASRR